jgi:hypothetical protein
MMRAWGTPGMFTSVPGGKQHNAAELPTMKIRKASKDRYTVPAKKGAGLFGCDHHGSKGGNIGHVNPRRFKPTLQLTAGGE